ncbi:hypothetical protein C8R43DRAFT_870767 [Mycena crocata]|nr:hypothetical protein C8R43DRAFT_870767 [Mycena crocata]
MALFRDHPIRSVAAVATALFIAHVVSLFVSFFHVFHLTQTSVAILAVSAVIYLITMHHRREGHLLTQTQEEMVLVFCFGLFWFAVLLGWRALRVQGSHVESSASGETRVAPVKRERQAPGMTGQVRPYPCSIDDVYCIVEDYSFF